MKFPDCRQLNPWVALMAWTFALSSWIDIKGLWQQMPIFVKELPEGWNLPSYIIVLIQCGTIFSLVYGVVASHCSVLGRSRLEVVMVYVITGVGLLSLILLAFLWNVTVYVAGQERSLPCLLLIFFLSMVDKTSSVVYLPYMARFKPQYITAYIVGEESSEFIAGGLAMIQGTAEDETCANLSVNATLDSAVTRAGLRFSLSAFVAVLAGIMALSMAAFTTLHCAPFGKKEMVENEYDAVSQRSQEPDTKETGLPELTNTKESRSISRREQGLINFFFFWSAMLAYGIFQSIRAFSCLPYGMLTYTLAIRLTCITNPLSAIVSFFLPSKSLRTISVLITLSSALVAYHVFIASTSPSPPLQHHIVGKICMVASTMLLSGSFAYCRASMAAVLREEGGGARALFYAGAAEQCGAVVGGVTGFVLVNVFEVFQRPPPCP